MKRFKDWFLNEEMKNLQNTSTDVVSKSNSFANPNAAAKTIQDAIKKITSDPLKAAEINNIKTVPNKNQAAKLTSQLAAKAKMNPNDSSGVNSDMVAQSLFKQITGMDMPSAKWSN